MNLNKTDPKIHNLIKREEKRQRTSLQMIPSENFASKAVREAEGSVLMDKYSEGYADKRYYQGNAFIDVIEKTAIERAKKLFKVPYVNVQPYSGSPANTAVYFALLNEGDLIMGMDLPSGGHLTHGHPKVTFSGKYFKTVQYSVEKDGKLNYQKIEELAVKHKPKIIISGYSAYPRLLNYKKFYQIAKKVGAYHMSDISHIAGLIVGEAVESPVPYSHIITTTTHKTLRGPRGALIMVTKEGLKKDPDLENKIDKAVFPGLQGGPHNNTTAAIAVCLKEADSKSFKKYARQIIKNAQTLSQELRKYGFDMTTNDTENHLLLINLSNKGIDGWCAAWALEYAGIIVNRNAVPFDTRSAFYPSGIRMGTPALTTQDMREKEMKKVAHWINEVTDIAINNLPKNLENLDKENAKIERKKFKSSMSKNKEIGKIRKEIEIFCKKFPLE